MTNRNKQPTDLIWIQTGFLGDVVITTAAFQAARECLPNTSQHLITTPIGASALRGHPYLDHIYSFDKRNTSLGAFRSEFKQKFKANAHGPNPQVMLAHRSFRSGLLAASLGMPVVCFAESDLPLPWFRKVPRVVGQHEAWRYANLLEQFGWNRENNAGLGLSLPETDLSGQSTWKQKIQDWAKDGRTIIGMAPGSVWGTKRWTTEGFLEVARHVTGSGSKFGLILLGSKAEQSVCQTIVDGIDNHDALINTSGKTTLDDLRSIYPQMKLMISNDSSSIHYASAFGIPTIAVFGATVPAMGFGPLAHGSRVVEYDLDCRPCSDHGPQTCPLGHFRCMKDIAPSRVISAIESVLMSVQSS